MDQNFLKEGVTNNWSSEWRDEILTTIKVQGSKYNQIKSNRTEHAPGGV